MQTYVKVWSSTATTTTCRRSTATGALYNCTLIYSHQSYQRNLICLSMALYYWINNWLYKWLSREMSIFVNKQQHSPLTQLLIYWNRYNCKYRNPFFNFAPKAAFVELVNSKSDLIFSCSTLGKRPGIQWKNCRSVKSNTSMSSRLTLVNWGSE